MRGELKEENQESNKEKSEPPKRKKHEPKKRQRDTDDVMNCIGRTLGIARSTRWTERNMMWVTSCDNNS